MTDRAKKITELTALTNASNDDLLVIVDSPANTAVTKKITVANFFANVATNATFKNTVTVSNTLTVGESADFGAIYLDGSLIVNTAGYWVGNSTGLKGQKGEVGSKGDKGEVGTTGSKGDKGEVGTTGAKGDKGETGTTGSKGDKGDSGSTGDKGETGATGAKGDKGDLGTTGDKGDLGTTGDKGDKGQKGEVSAVPGPYTDDADAQSNGVAVGQMYYRSTGIVYVRLV